MSRWEVVDREAASLRDELYQAADSDLYPEEQEILFELHQSIAKSLRGFLAGGAAGGETCDRARVACTTARRALDDLEAGDTDGLQVLVRRVAEATEALEAAR